MDKSIKSEKGITLIAVVVAIIIMMLLASISIVIIMRRNGVIDRTVESKYLSIQKTEMEKLKVEVLGSFDENGDLILENLNTNIKNNISEATTDDAANFPLTVTFEDTSDVYVIDREGNIE